MSDDLTTFRDHCARMAKADHIPECRGWQVRPNRWGRNQSGWVWPSPHCPGCITDEDRALWARLAQEVDDYLTPATEEGLFA